ncbi:hypothetical protein F2Q70_00011468 [Brassica cretica]|uniref:Uncharacterized protein n=1 Tax=Brassica cretica TaxID=69181 RepID=A0A8S9MCR8_BRACR|nr:hypothetical protein F2Q70_00011468 [Brassica cretica]
MIMASEAVLEPGGLDPEIADWNPEESEGSSLDPKIFDWNPEAIGEPGGSSLGTVLHLPRQDYYRKYLAGLEGAGVDVMTHVLGFAVFHVWRSRILIAPCTFYTGTLGMPMRLRLYRGFSFCKGWPGSEVSGDLIQLGPYSAFLGKTTTGLEGAGVGVMTHVLGFAAFHVWRSRIFIAP